MSKRELVELFPFGVTVDRERPMLILKDKSKTLALAVWLNAVEAGLCLADAHFQSNPGSSPHKITEKILKFHGAELESCVFDEVVGFHQYVQLKFKLGDAGKTLRCRADECMSLCLNLKVPLWGTKSFIRKSRQITTELVDTGRKLNQQPDMKSKSHPFLM